MMPFAVGQQLTGALQPLPGFDHVARCEAIFAAPILAKLDQSGEQ
jgi:hypothetical protein